jgi:Bacterial protein of unknown function (DUF899)
MIHAKNMPTAVDRAAFEAEIEGLRSREKAHTREGDAIAAARRRREDSPAGWPQPWQVDGSNTRMNGRPIAQWSRIDAGRSDDLTVAR